MSLITSLVHWPDALMPRSGGFVPVFANRSGGRTQGKMADQIIRSGRGFWRASFRDWTLVSPLMQRAGLPEGQHDQSLRAWRGLEVEIGGKAGAISLPAFDFWNAPWPTVGGVVRRTVPGSTFSDGTTFSDGSMFAGSVIGAELAASAGVNALTVRLAFTAGSVDVSGLRGAHFSLADGDIGDRLHRIVRADLVSGATYDCTIWPWLRGDYLSGLPAEFDRPRCAMRLAKDDGMAVFPEGGRWAAGVAVDFEEFDAG
ncbi:hypothetical protein [Methylobrevis pamukkalensis]|uniref:Uncharacterized protein n=1 Tax=Methylobrevis pamukkalensis TaxID=1439726 RepID=A0A1E3H165_9HYPH|nr:hypothetical protein [Methylobrevis pamukkalensis]ODN69556.1 hypothetical protein A6302_03150 [Methylobrevis pamukkalensis]